MRLFLAIIPDNGIKDELCMIQKRLQLQGVKGNYTKRENMHLTLAFIGEYNDPGYISDVLSGLVLEPIRLVINGFGSFNDLYWIGIAEDKGLEVNVKRIRRALSDNGIPFDRKKFMPHMTIARNIVFSGDTSIVKMTMIDGKILYEDGKFTTIDLDEVYKETNKLMKDLSDI